MNTPAQCGAIKPPKTDIYSEAPHNLPGRLVNRSGKHTLRLPANWPWAHTFTQTLKHIRNLPQHC